MENPPIIALTSSFGSGSSRVAEILSQEHGYYHEKVSDLLKKESERRGTKFEDISLSQRRKRLQDVGNELRKENGPGYLTRQIIKGIMAKKVDRPVVFESIKNPGEVMELRKYPNTYLLAVNASFDMRWKRVKVRNYDGDYNQFIEDDERDKNEGLPYGQNVEKCVDLADIYIKNDEDRKTKSDWEKFGKKIYETIKVVEKKGSRSPSSRELLMNNAYHTSLTSDCLKRQVGAIIAVPRNAALLPGVQEMSEKGYAKEYVVSSGANVVPEKQLCCEVEFGECYRDQTREVFLDKMRYCPNCKEKLNSNHKKCPKCEIDFIKEYRGKMLGLCRALHAEESAILQTCLLGGSSLVGATLYTTTFPCLSCTKKIIAVGIKRVVWVEPYPDPEAIKMLEKAGVELIEFEGVKARAYYELFSAVD